MEIVIRDNPYMVQNGFTFTYILYIKTFLEKYFII